MKWEEVSPTVSQSWSFLSHFDLPRLLFWQIVHVELWADKTHLYRCSFAAVAVLPPVFQHSVLMRLLSVLLWMVSRCAVTVSIMWAQCHRDNHVTQYCDLWSLPIKRRSLVTWEQCCAFSSWGKTVKELRQSQQSVVIQSCKAAWMYINMICTMMGRWGTRVSWQPNHKKNAVIISVELLSSLFLFYRCSVAILVQSHWSY